MNQLRSWLYGRDLSVNDRHKGANFATDESSSQNDRISQERNKQMESRRRNLSESTTCSYFLRVIPLAPGDCLQCKLVGTSVMVISGVIVMMSAITSRTRNTKLAGYNGAVYYLLCGSLFLGFEVAAFCRLFDVGPFEKHSGNVAKTTK